ncbi:hypothetical protein BJ875DRAFT_510653 [Amylocarpus encephaloides]|uniref:Uncharacterized protein n=1 Tax=Amylocarpus encephaloides TaxID=45428 RepID=A0A9P7YI82_9HELO|nr:hypothetical protein BJ875DRAFT_510653 [Amylocarpus encephaloides]
MNPNSQGALIGGGGWRAKGQMQVRLVASGCVSKGVGGSRSPDLRRPLSPAFHFILCIDGCGCCCKGSQCNPHGISAENVLRSGRTPTEGLHSPSLFLVRTSTRDVRNDIGPHSVIRDACHTPDSRRRSARHPTAESRTVASTVAPSAADGEAVARALPLGCRQNPKYPLPPALWVAPGAELRGRPPQAAGPPDDAGPVTPVDWAHLHNVATQGRRRE